MFDMLIKSAKTKIATGSYPDGDSGASAAYRGGPVRIIALCRDCGKCREECPAGALRVDGNCDLAVCSMCGACAAVCPNGAMVYSGAFELARTERMGLVRNIDVSVDPNHSKSDDPYLLSDGSDCGAARQALGEKLSKRIKGLFGRSLHIRHVDTGSCNACDWEMTSLLNPVHDIQRFGIDFVASPRHADLLMVTGSVSRHLEEALLSTYRCQGEPKLVMALGSCACGGGLFSRTYVSRGGVDRVVPVDMYVPGCPPRPQSIIYALLLLMGRMKK